MDNSPHCEKFSLKFGGAASIEAGLLGRAILDMSLLIGETTSADNTLDKVKLRVEAFRVGSFEVCFELIAEYIQTGLENITLTDIMVVLTCIKTFFDIKKHLKGERPKSFKRNDDHTIIILPNNLELRVPPGSELVLTNKEVDRLVSDVSNIANIHDKNGGLSIVDRTGAIDFTPDEIRDIAQQQPFEKPKDSKLTNIMRATLLLNTVDLRGQSSWKFRFGKRSLSANIDDASFQTRLHSGQIAIHSGDKLDVDLETTITQSPIGEILSEKHNVVKVHRHIPVQRTEQIGPSE